MPELKELLEKLQGDMQTNWKELKTNLDTQADQIRTFGETKQETADKITAIEKKLEDQTSEFKGLFDQVKELELKAKRPGYGQEEKQETAGSLFAASDAYKNMLQMKSYNSAPVEIKKFYTKATLTSAAGSAGALVSPTNIGLLPPLPAFSRVRDLLNTTPIQSNSVEYVRETGYTNAAAPQAGEGAVKAESALTFDVETANVKTLAHWIPASKQILADAPMLQNYIDTRLVYGLGVTEDAQILYGTGVGDNLQGILTTPGVQAHGGIAAGDTRIDHIRRAITRTLIAGYPATGIVMHPGEWEEIELAKGTDGHYIWVNVGTGNEPRLFRVPVVQSISMATTTDFVVGAFGLGAQLFDREEANVRVAEQHGDFFIRNMVAILAEERLALATYRPEAFVVGSFTAAV